MFSKTQLRVNLTFFLQIYLYIPPSRTWNSHGIKVFEINPFSVKLRPVRKENDCRQRRGWRRGSGTACGNGKGCGESQTSELQREGGEVQEHCPRWLHQWYIIYLQKINAYFYGITTRVSVPRPISSCLNSDRWDFCLHISSSTAHRELTFSDPLEGCACTVAVHQIWIDVHKSA